MQVLAYKLELKLTLSPDIVNNYNTSHSIISVAPDSVTLPLMRYVSTEAFNRELSDLRHELNKYKNYVKGSIIINELQGTTNKSGILKLAASKFNYVPGTLKITCQKANDKPSKKQLTQEEKLNLLKAWHEEHPNELPDKNALHNGFKVGKFYSTIVANGALKEVVDNIFGTN